MSELQHLAQIAIRAEERRQQEEQDRKNRASQMLRDARLAANRNDRAALEAALNAAEALLT